MNNNNQNSSGIGNSTIPIAEPPIAVSNPVPEVTPVTNNPVLPAAPVINSQPITPVVNTPLTIKSTKPKLPKIIFIIIAAIILIAAGIFVVFKFVLNKDNAQKSQETTKVVETITNDKIASYGIKSIARWGDLALNISYLIPEAISPSMFNGTQTFSYLHGHSFNYLGGYDIYVEKSLNGSTDLNTLAADIIKEKMAEKYKELYYMGKETTEIEIEENENIKVGKYDTVYFESKQITKKSAFGDEMKVKYIGYSLKYNKQYIAVYAEVLVSKDVKEGTVKEYLQYVINSFEDYNKESFYELDNNFTLKSLFDDGFTNTFNDEIATKFTINSYSDHGANWGVRPSHDYGVDLRVDALNWDGNLDTLFRATVTPKTYFYQSYDETVGKYYPNFWYMFYWTSFDWEGDLKQDASNLINEYEYEIKSEESVKINNIDMKRYLVKYYSNADKTYGNYVVVYTFMIDNRPYLTQYALDNGIYDAMPFATLTTDQEKMIIDQLSLNADTMIRTIRILDTTQDEYTYQDYVMLF